MSALPPKADMCGATRDVCFGPKADIRASRSRQHHAIEKRGLGYSAATTPGRLHQEFFHCIRERFGPLDIAYVTGAGDLDKLRAVQLLVHFPHRCVRWILFANQE